MNYPKIKRVNIKDTFHGVEVADPYRWLEDDSEERNSWMDSQIKLTSEVMGPQVAPFKGRLRDRMEGLMRVESMGMPGLRGKKRFFGRRNPDQEFGVLYVQDTPDSQPTVLLDPNSWSEDKKTTLSGSWVSPKGSFVAYAMSQSGNDKVSIHLKNVSTGEMLSDTIPDDLYPGFIDWDEEETGFWYHKRFPKDVPMGEEKQYQKIFFHKLGDDISQDELVFGRDAHKQDYLWLNVSECNRYLLYYVMPTYKGDDSKSIFIFDRHNPSLGLVPIFEDTQDEHSLEIESGFLYDMTNTDAPMYKLVRAPLDFVFARQELPWSVVVPESDNVLISQTEVVGDEIYVSVVENVSSCVRVYDLEGHYKRTLDLPSHSTFTGLSWDKDSDEMFYGYTNFFVRHDIFRVDRKTGEHSLFYRHSGGLDPDKFEVKQHWYHSKDGTRVPIFVLHKKGLKYSGDHPTVLYGYGGFRISLLPSFDSTIVPFLERGGVYAIANIRGGNEFGEGWHKAGVLEKKQNVFDDFIAAAVFLCFYGYTSSQRLAISGWSNGGLLTSACLLQRPDLFKAVIVGAPVADMMRYHKFDGGYHWIDNYGNPEDKSVPRQFESLIKYSPVHNVKVGGYYPATLIVTADSDDRTHPMHAFKFGAAMQYGNVSPNPILFLIERKAGHGGAASVSNSAIQEADIWSFIFWQLGVDF